MCVITQFGQKEAALLKLCLLLFCLLHHTGTTFKSNVAYSELLVINLISWIQSYKGIIKFNALRKQFFHIKCMCLNVCFH